MHITHAHARVAPSAPLHPSFTFPTQRSTKCTRKDSHTLLPSSCLSILFFLYSFLPTIVICLVHNTHACIVHTCMCTASTRAYTESLRPLAFQSSLHLYTPSIRGHAHSFGRGGKGARNEHLLLEHGVDEADGDLFAGTALHLRMCVCIYR